MVLCTTVVENNRDHYNYCRSCRRQKTLTMAFEADYKEAFNNESATDVPVKIHIIAPSTLPEGYIFEAEIGAPGAKKTISVEVVSVSISIMSHFPMRHEPTLQLLSIYHIDSPSLPTIATRRCRRGTNFPDSTPR